MAKLECPQGHLAVIREDPKTTGKRAMCDTCGWEAQFARTEGGKGDRYEPNDLRANMELEGERRTRTRELAAGAPERRG